MTASTTILPALIKAGHSHRIVDGRGVEVHCRKGRIWITQTGDERDIELAAGETFTLDRDGLALVVAIGQPAATEIVYPAETTIEAALHALKRARHILPGSGRAAA